jgi:hypothetical protein
MRLADMYFLTAMSPFRRLRLACHCMRMGRSDERAALINQDACCRLNLACNWTDRLFRCPVRYPD